jgi:AraC-like DNA-binding protein
MAGSVTARQQESRGVASAALLCELAADRVADPATILHGTGIPARALTDPEAEITSAQDLRLIENLTNSLDDPDSFALDAGTTYHLWTYGVWSYAILSSKTVRDAHSVALQFVDLTYAFTHVSAIETSQGFVVTYDDPADPVPEPVRRFVIVRDMAAALTIWREGLARPVSPLRVTLRLSAPDDPACFENLFGVMPEFGAERSTLTWELSLLDLRPPQASELAAKICEAECAELLDRRHARRGLSGRVRNELLAGAGRTPTQEEVARQFHVSVRTLRRQLATEGTTFRAMVEQTRQGLAEELLATGRLTVEQVADRVGYAEASSFVHAFRRWNGVAPRRWAREQASPVPADVALS